MGRKSWVGAALVISTALAAPVGAQARSDCSHSDQLICRTPTATPTLSPTGTPTTTPTQTAKTTPTDTPAATVIPTASSTATQIAAPTGTATVTPTATLTVIASPTLTATGSVTPAATATGTATSTPTATATSTSGGVPADLSARYASDTGQFASLSGATVQATAFGVKCDGSTDDSAALTGAVAGANGQTLQLPAGTCLLASVTFPSGQSVSLVGQGQGTTILEKIACSSCAPMLSLPGAGSSPYQQLEIHNLTLDGNMAHVSDWSNDHSAAVGGRPDNGANVNYFLADSIELRHTLHEGIALDSIRQVGVIRNSSLHDVAVHTDTFGQDPRMINIDADTSSQITGNMWIVNNNLAETDPTPTDNLHGASGIHSPAAAKQKLFITGNTLRSLGEAFTSGSSGEWMGAIDCYRNCDGSEIESNQIFNALYAPIRIDTSNNVTVKGNTISGEGPVGSEAAAIYWTSRDSDNLGPFSGYTVTGNTIQNLPDQPAVGIETDSANTLTSVSIDHNTISGSGGATVLTSFADNVTVNSNGFSSDVTPLVEVDNNGGAVGATGNTCSPVVAKSSAITLSGSPSTESGNCWD